MLLFYKRRSAATWPSPETLILMIFCASPSAAVGYVIAQKAGGDGELAASAIFISTALSVISLGVVIACFG